VIFASQAQQHSILSLSLSNKLASRFFSTLVDTQAIASYNSPVPRWFWFMVVGFILFLIQVRTPDLVDEFINGLLQNPNSPSFTGAVPLLKASLVIWNISGIGLFVAGIVDLVLKRRRGQFY
jgi:hypothetical protein